MLGHRWDVLILQCPSNLHEQMTEQESYISAVKTFNRYLESKRLRKTPERFAILKKIWQMKCHFSVDVLCDALKADNYHVSRATVYNTVELLLLSGVVRRHQFNSGEASYEAAIGSHIHLICTGCGKITEVSVEDVEKTAMEAIKCRDFQPQYYSVYVYGLCADCTSDTMSTEEKRIKPDIKK